MYGLKKVRHSRNDDLARITWQEFERLLAAHYRERGYRVEHVGGGRDGASWPRFDGGVDLKLRRADEYVVVQCKHWNQRQVPHNVVHELLGVMMTERASAAIVVTSGEFTAAARAAAARQPAIELVDGQLLREILGPLPSPRFDGAHGAEGIFHGHDPDAGFLRLGGARHGRRARARRGDRAARAAIALLIALSAIVLAHILSHARVEALAPPLSSPAIPMQDGSVAQAMPSLRAESPSPVASRLDSTSSDAQELHDWQRRNDEAMKIIEKTTPEVAH